MANDSDDVIFVCSRTSLNHVVRFSFWPVPEGKGHEEGDGDAYISVSLDIEKSFWKRLKTAIVFLFRGQTCRYGDTAEVILKSSDYPKLRTWLDRAEKNSVPKERKA